MVKKLMSWLFRTEEILIVRDSIDGERAIYRSGKLWVPDANIWDVEDIKGHVFIDAAECSHVDGDWPERAEELDLWGT